MWSTPRCRGRRCVVDHDTITLTLTCAWNAQQKASSSNPASLSATRSQELRSPLAPSSAYATRYRTRPNLRVCQLVKVSRHEEVMLVCRRWQVPCRHPAQPILTSGGSLCFQSPETLLHPRPPVKGALPRTEVPLPETRISPSRSTCRREKRTLTCLSGTQRLSHIDMTMSSAWAVAFPRRVATARWHRLQQLGNFSSEHVLCQVLASACHCVPALVAPGCDLREQPK